jgi:hypothetical protein
VIVEVVINTLLSNYWFAGTCPLGAGVSHDTDAEALNDPTHVDHTSLADQFAVHAEYTFLRFAELTKTCLIDNGKIKDLVSGMYDYDDTNTTGEWTIDGLLDGAIVFALDEKRDFTFDLGAITLKNAEHFHDDLALLETSPVDPFSVYNKLYNSFPATPLSIVAEVQFGTTGESMTHAGIGLQVDTIGVVVDAMVKASKSRFSALRLNETINFDCLLGSLNYGGAQEMLLDIEGIRLLVDCKDCTGNPTMIQFAERAKDPNAMIELNLVISQYLDEVCVFSCLCDGSYLHKHLICANTYTCT